MNPEQALAGIESLADARVVGTLNRGPVSDSYLIEHNKGQFVLRLDNEVAVPLGLDRKAEAEVLAVVGRHQLGPELRYADPPQGIQVTRYIEGRVWTESDLHDEECITRLAELLRQLHALETHGQPLQLLDKVDHYARIIGTAEGRELAEETRQLSGRLNQQPVSHCLCHNDAHCANLIDGQALILIDWEYAGIGEPMFELAVIAEHHQFNHQQTDTLLDAYFGTVREEHMQRLSGYRLLYLHLLVLWLTSVEQLGEPGAELRVLLQQARHRLQAAATG
ncbi:MAG: choline/ethanolamine kinase family protein [Gammaproteobacteria bacterium]|nr:hypothetical protein [Chromatiales bacterium]MCP4925866.1 phosphotransferase family protein [Gammaproteobacteria bacterium]MDP7296666.1 choline/ethanolamine kinase family protein [Gammaproteobacteria bacterium]MDP7419633.1 choline/ethanolamine kinase family protein [Gammaproteobacteria bacterium]MDP7660257.1 choline/ethanolamine kinase family protein [Gammaproteobacteria bacterium]